MSKEQLIDLKGNSIILGSKIGKGGEGVVYNIQNNPNEVAKLYLKKPDQEKSYKIINMVRSCNERLLKLSAWPINSIHNKSGDVIGFIMQKIQGFRPLFELYSPKLRLQAFPQADWRFLIHSATNTARAFSVIHESGHVIGDVNHGNLLVSNDATVKFIDTDSFQISINGKQWLCEVGVNTHQPPEMQGKTTYKGIIRTPNQDNFGLAILIFQLLCLARHPFSGRFLGHGEMPIEKAIKECRFAYSRNNTLLRMTPPPASLSMNALSPNIWSLFEKAFAKESITNGIRPTSIEWISALENLAKSLTVCQNNRSHYYLKGLSNCPWCDIEAISNIILFPIIIQFPSSNLSFQILWQQVLAIKDPEEPPPLPSLISVSSSKEAQEIRKKCQRLKNQSVILLSASLVIMIISILFFDFSIFQLFLLGQGIWIYFYHKKKINVLTKDIVKQLSEIRDRWYKLSSIWNDRNYESQFKLGRDALDELKKKHDSLSNERQCKIQKLWGARQQQQLQDHLDKYLINNSKIEGFGSSRKATLQSYGIETAADIDYHRIEKISGFGSKLIERLVKWRLTCERAFVFDSNKGVSQSEIQSIDRQIAATRYNLEKELIKGIANLKILKQRNIEQRKKIHSQATDMIHSFALAIANAKEVGCYK